MLGTLGDSVSMALFGISDLHLSLDAISLWMCSPAGRITLPGWKELAGHGVGEEDTGGHQRGHFLGAEAGRNREDFPFFTACRGRSRGSQGPTMTCGGPPPGKLHNWFEEKGFFLAGADF